LAFFIAQKNKLIILYYSFIVNIFQKKRNQKYKRKVSDIYMKWYKNNFAKKFFLKDLIPLLKIISLNKGLKRENIDIIYLLLFLAGKTKNFNFFAIFFR
jgi:hypothetical protein